MKMIILYVVGLTAVVLLGVAGTKAEQATTQILVAMSLLTGEDQKPPVVPPPKPKAPPPGSPGQAPAQPAGPAKPATPAPAAGTPTPTPAAPAAPQAGAKPPAPATAPAAPTKPGTPAPPAGTPVPTPAAPAAPPAGAKPPAPAVPPPAATPPAMTTATPPGAPTPPMDSADGYSYDPKSRRDPFQSLTKTIKSASLQSQMPPLQRVQISDMKLLGILWGGYGFFGLIQTPDGKGYTVKEGVLLGTNNGVIKTITDKAIIVSEPTIDIAGRKSTKEVEILLRPRELPE